MSDDENLFTCAECAGTFAKDWSDEEAAAERDANFPGGHPFGFAVVCDDCFEKVMKANHPTEYQNRSRA